MTSLNPSLRLALISKAKAQKNIIQKGFTLVELMVVVLVVGVLSAVALPQFLGVKDKAELGSQIGEAAGLAKECAAAILIEGPYPAAYSLSSGLTASANCRGANATTAPAANVVFTTEAATVNSAGTNCGGSGVAAAKKCAITVNKDTGAITYNAAAT